MSALPLGWTERTSSRHPGRPYWYNTVTNDSVWERPSSSMAEPEQVRCSHILRKHAGSRRPSSWRVPTVTISKEEASQEIAAMRADIIAGKATFEELAATSDCSSAKQAEDLGFFSRGQMQKPFEDPAFKLQVGEISGLVDSDSGIHIIKRTG